MVPRRQKGWKDAKRRRQKVCRVISFPLARCVWVSILLAMVQWECLLLLFGKCLTWLACGRRQADQGRKLGRNGGHLSGEWEESGMKMRMRRQGL